MDDIEVVLVWLIGDFAKINVLFGRILISTLLQVVMEVHPLLGQLDCLLAGEEAKRGEKIIFFTFTFSKEG